MLGIRKEISTILMDNNKEDNCRWTYKGPA